MKQFRLLTRTRQITEYSCGACALQAVMSYWGKDETGRGLPMSRAGPATD